MAAIDTTEAWVALRTAISRDMHIPEETAEERLSEASKSDEGFAHFTSDTVRNLGNLGNNTKDAAIDHRLSIVVRVGAGSYQPGIAYWVKGDDYSGEYPYDQESDDIVLTLVNLQDAVELGRTLQDLAADISAFSHESFAPFRVNPQVLASSAVAPT